MSTSSTSDTFIAAPGIPRRHGRSGWFVSILDLGAALALFLQVTELYRPLGHLARFPNSQSVNAAFLLFFAVYLAINARALLRILRFKIILKWTSVFLAFPVLIMSLQVLAGIVGADRFFYWTMFSLIFLELFLTSALLWIKFGDRLSVLFFVGCIGATWIGFAVNILAYGFLREVLEFSANRIAASDATTRILGFYPHPNMAAFSLCVYFSCLAGDPDFLARKLWLRMLIVSSCFTGILLTGSRTSLILFFIVFFWHLKATRTIRAKRASASRAFRLVSISFLLVVVVLLIYYATRATANSTSDLAAMIISRVETLVDLLNGNIVANDASVGIRVNIVGQYLTDIKERPLLGYGPDYAFEQIDKGAFSNVSQNSWVEWALKFGVAYSLLVAITMLSTYWLGQRRRRVQPWLSLQTKLLLVIYLVAMFSIVDIFWLRSATCAVGSLLGLLLLNKSTPDIEIHSIPQRPQLAQSTGNTC